MLAVAAITSCVAVTAHAQVPTADEVLARHEAAIGGRAALDAHSTLRVAGVVIIESAEGTIEIVRGKPNLYHEKIALPRMGTMHKGYDGKTAWVMDTDPALLTDADAETMKRQADWHHEFIVPQALRGARVDSAEFEGQPVWRLTYASSLGDEVHSYFSRATGLRIGEESVLGVGSATTTYSEYKTFGGVKFATSILSRRGQSEMLVNYVTIEFDKVPPSAFALPPAVKAIAKDD